MSGRNSSVTAYDAALRLLTRRPRTESELRARLIENGRDEAEVAAACERLRARGLLDDRRLAEDFATLRGPRLGHGPERLVRELCARGVEPHVAEAAVRACVERGDLAPADLLRRKIVKRLGDPAARLDYRGYARMYTALRRAGFGDESIRRELEPFRESEPHNERDDHDLP